MNDKFPTTRRNILATGGALGAAGFGLSTGLFLRPGLARAAKTTDVLPVTIINPEGSLTGVEQQMLKTDNYFADFGVKADILNVADGSKILAALISGNGDICCGSGFSGLFPAIEKGAKIKVLAGAAVSPLTGLVSNNPEIKSAKDLVGHTVGVGAPGALLHELTVALLQKKGIDWHKVKFVNIGSSVAVFQAVAGGTVDAGPVEVNYFNQAARFKLHTLTDGAFWNELPLYTNQAMYASDETIANKRETLVRTLAAWAKVFRYISSPGAKKDFFDAYLALGANNKPADIAPMWEFYHSEGKLANNLVLSDAQLDYVQKLNVELGVQKKVLPLSEVADMSLARDALKLLKTA